MGRMMPRACFGSVGTGEALSASGGKGAVVIFSSESGFCCSDLLEVSSFVASGIPGGGVIGRTSEPICVEGIL